MMNKYYEIFKKINSIILERYVLLDEKNINWSIVSKKYESKLKDIKNEVQFVELIDNMLLRLEDPHISFYDTMYVPKYYLPLLLGFANNEIVVLTDGVIPKGAVILEIDGISINDLIDSYKNKIPLAAVKMRILQNIYHKLSETTNVRYSYHGVKNDIIVNNLKTNPNTHKSIKIKNVECMGLNNITTRKIDSDINYLKIDFFDKGTANNTYEWIKTVPKGSNLIIDIRGCKGGYVEETISTVSLFLERSLNLGKKVSNLNGKNKEESVNVSATFSSECFEKIAVLVDNFTMSSAEFIFLRAILKNKNTILIGEKTAGIVHGTTSFIIDKRYLLTLTTSKYYNEHGDLLRFEGICPDVIVTSVSKKFEDKSDSCLNHAIMNLY